MPRRARKQSPTNIYHVMLRGINYQEIFEDKEDYSKFLAILREVKTISEYYMYAFCLMGNHVHMLIEPDKEPLALVMKRIGCRYVHWFNKKYQRVGHLFQDRYQSVTVDDERQFLVVLRYIHQNPIKAKICCSINEYPWSSFSAYCGHDDKITDAKKMRPMFGTEKDIIDFLNVQTEENLENNCEFCLTDLQAKQIISDISKCESVSEFQKIDPDRRNFYIKEFQEKGLSARQISRMCGMSKMTAGRVKVD
ncbi:MAG: transposase [Lachnospiraceae bacterium]|nr:transposase [Lachnospiraceae bacterium]